MAELVRLRGGDNLGRAATSEQIRVAESLHSHEWTELIPFSELAPGYEDSHCNFFEIHDESRYTHLRLNMFPDGGIARLRVYGDVQVDWSVSAAAAASGGDYDHEIDLASVLSGGKALGCSDKHFGHPRNLIQPGRGVNMGDGWETARKITRPPVLVVDPSSGLVQGLGSDWAILELGTAGVVSKIEIDTAHFKGNYPESCQVRLFVPHLHTF